MKYQSLAVIPLFSVLCLTALMSGCGSKAPNSSESENTQTSSEESTATMNTQSSNLDFENPDIIIATDTSNAPFEMQGEKGDIIGLNVDIVDAIAKDQGFTYNFKPRKWQGIFKEIESGSSDIITGIVVASDDRRQKYDFTDTIHVKKRYAYMTNETAQAHQVESFADICPLKVAVKKQTDKSKLYESVCGTDNPNMIALSSSNTAFEKMVNGSVDVAIGDDILFDHYLIHHGLDNIVSFVDPNDKSIDLAWPVKKGNIEVLEKFNKGLKSLKDSGKYDQIVNQWLNEDDHSHHEHH